MDNIESYEDLGNAIIKRACDDYVAERRKQIKGFKKEGCEQECQRKIDEIIEFFSSQFFQLLTDLDPDYILWRLEKEILANEESENNSCADKRKD